MRSLRSLALILAVAVPVSAFAQLDDDDLLAPLTDEPLKKKKWKAKPKRKRAPSASKKEPAAVEADDPLLESLVSNKTELLVKLPANFKGAILFVDGKDLGPVTGGAVEVTPGEHTVTLKRIGYAEFTRRISAKPAEVTELAASMQPIAGVLAVTVEPSDAEVLVDGTLVGTGNVTDIALIPGDRTVTLRKEGMQQEHVQLSVKPGKDYPVSATLKPSTETETTKALVAQNADRPENNNLSNPDVTADEPLVPLRVEGEPEAETPMYKRWYVWAGLGAVVAGGVAGAIAVSQSNGAASSTGVEPNTVCGGACDGTINWPGMRF